MRWLSVSLSLGVLTIAGCVSMEVALDSKPLRGVPVQTPDPSKINPASLQVAERVQSLGQRIIDQNTFTGLAPLFHTVSVPESMLFHRGPDELFISEALVQRCKTEAELAAVLCRELGRMMAEKRTARAVGVDLASVHELGGTIPSTIGEGEIASAAPALESPPTNAAKKGPKADADLLAKELLRGAGFEPESLDTVRDLLKDVKGGDGFIKQVAGPAPAPRWQH